MNPSSNTETSQVLVITGLSGAGKSSFTSILEDSGFFCIDKLPVTLLPKVIELARARHDSRAKTQFAFSIDCYTSEDIDSTIEIVSDLRSEGNLVRLLFLDASNSTISRRYSESRRPHPAGQSSLIDSIDYERQRLATLRDQADIILDTSTLNIHQFRAIIESRFVTTSPRELTILLSSFGFKHGLPQTSDIVFDVRFLDNPYFIESLRDKRGTDAAVRDYVLQQPAATEVLQLFDFIANFFPRYKAEGKSYLHIAIGCTGGKHRSVAIVEAVAERWRPLPWAIQVQHRDI